MDTIEDDLTQLIRSGDLDGLRGALARDPSLASTPVEGAPSAILLAVYHGQTGIAHLLRDAKPDLDVFEAAALGDAHAMERLLARDEGAFDAFSADGFQPLGYAAFFGHLEMVRLLLEAGANPNVRSRNGISAAPLHSALANGHKQIAKLLIESGADVNDASNGWTPLHYVAHSGDVETARILLDRGAKPVPNREGETPAGAAREKGFTDLAALLEG